MLSGASEDFDFANADLTEQQAELVLNITRQGAKKEESAYKSFHKKDYDWDAYPLNIFGTRCEVHRGEDDMTSLSFKTYSAFYISAALDGFRCYKVLPIGGTALSMADTVMFYPECLRTPIKTEGENLADIIDKLRSTLIDMKITEKNDKSLKEVIAKIKERAKKLSSDEIESYLKEETDKDMFELITEHDGFNPKTEEEHAASEGENEEEEEEEGKGEENDDNEDTDAAAEADAAMIQPAASEGVTKNTKKPKSILKQPVQRSTKPTKGAKKNAAKKRKRANVDRTNPYSEREVFKPRVREPRIRELHSNEQLPQDDESNAEENCAGLLSQALILGFN
jgi:hypothetical protein